MEMLAGGVLLGVAGLIAGEASKVHLSRISGESWWSLAYLIVFGALVGFTAYVWLLRVTRTSLVSTYAYVNPVIAVFAGWLLLSEAITWRTFVGGAIIVLGVLLIVTAREVPTAGAESLEAIGSEPGDEGRDEGAA
jgi:drug/metabolite transporter (DMT)-like permease